MRRASVVVGAVTLFLLAGQALADDLNPQPEPPGKHKVMLNPQPLPPGVRRRQEPPDPCLKAYGSGGGTGKALNIGSATSGAGAGKVQAACTTGQHPPK